jgi:hypothetical protein
LLTASALVAALRCDKAPSEDRPSRAAASKEGDRFVRQLNDERIVAIHQWHVEDAEEKSMLCLFRAFDSDPHYKGSGIKLSILDPSGVSIYDLYFNELQRVYSTTALRGLSDQLVIEVSYGGSTSFLHMLDYRDGKVVELIDEKESDFDVGAEVRPQFRRGVTPGTEPFQVMLTRGIGLASPARKYTSVYRYRDGKYQHFGDFSQQQVDDYIEDLLTHVARHKNQE